MSLIPQKEANCDGRFTLTAVEQVESAPRRPVQPSDLPWAQKWKALVLILLLNCAAYWFGASLGPLKEVLKSELSLNNSQYAVISAAGHLVNTVIPVISGVAIDYYGPEYLSMAASTSILLGAVIAAAGASEKSFQAILVGEVVVGFGSATIETAQLKMYTTWFRGSHLGFVFGLNHAFNHLIILISKSTAIPITDGTHSWTWAFWVPATISVFVFGINVCYIFFERRLPNQYRLLPGRHRAKMVGHRGLRTELRASWGILNDLPAAFWLITLTQICQDASVQTYGVLTPSIYTVTRGASQLSAGLIAAVAQVPVIVLTPVIGIVMDRFGNRMAFSPVASILFIVAFSLAGFTTVNSAACSVIQGLALSFNFIPFTLALPLLVQSNTYQGTAQGTYAAFINAGHVIILTASGSLQDQSPRGRHQYDSVLYLLLAIKALDIFFAIFYIILDRTSLNLVLTRPETAQKERDAGIAAGSTIERRGWLRDTRRPWTIAGLVVGAGMTIVAWAVYIRFAVEP